MAKAPRTKFYNLLGLKKEKKRKRKDGLRAPVLTLHPLPHTHILRVPHGLSIP